MVNTSMPKTTTSPLILKSLNQDFYFHNSTSTPQSTRVFLPPSVLLMPKHLPSRDLLGSLSTVHPFCILSGTGARAVKMKGRASVFLKQVVSAIVSLVKAKSMAVKNKTSAMKTRFMILRILRNKKALLSSISHKIHALVGHDKGDALLPCNAPAEDEEQAKIPVHSGGEEEREDAYNGEVDDDDEDDGYPDLTHSLFDEDGDDGLGDCTGSVIDLVRNNREDGTEFKLEDEIDHVAEMFIRRFHKQMRLQQQQSFKRYQEMLERSG